MTDADEILTIRQLASLLKVGEKTAYTMAQSGELPAFKVRGQWRFRRSDIDAWIHQRVSAAAPSASQHSARPSDDDEDVR